MFALTIENVKKSYNKFEVLKGISFAINTGDFFALLGPNGAGKTTLIGIVSTLVKKTSGNVYIFGYDLDRQTEQAKSLIGVVPQEFNFPLFDKVKEVIINQAGFYGIPRSIAIQRTEKYLKQLVRKENEQRTLSGIVEGDAFVFIYTSILYIII